MRFAPCLSGSCERRTNPGPRPARCGLTVGSLVGAEVAAASPSQFEVVPEHVYERTPRAGVDVVGTGDDQVGGYVDPCYVDPCHVGLDDRELVIGGLVDRCDGRLEVDGELRYSGRRDQVAGGEVEHLGFEDGVGGPGGGQGGAPLLC